jgi:hypothetical protein
VISYRLESHHTGSYWRREWRKPAIVRFFLRLKLVKVAVSSIETDIYNHKLDYSLKKVVLLIKSFSNAEWVCPIAKTFEENFHFDNIGKITRMKVCWDTPLNLNSAINAIFLEIAE